MAFSSSVESWQQDLMNTNKENIDDAMQWLDTIRATGNSYLLQALKVRTSIATGNIYHSNRVGGNSQVGTLP
jgi:hypothetical protein